MLYIIISIVTAIWRYETTGDDDEAFVFGMAWPFGILCLLVGWFIDRQNKIEELQEPMVVFKKNRKVHYCEATTKGLEEFWMNEPMCKTKAKEAQFTSKIKQVTCKRCLTLLRRGVHE
jgi:hypothetical protein